MEKKSIKSENIFLSEEEKILNWQEIQKQFEKVFGSEIYSSWLKNVSLLKEFNDHIVLGVPTRFFRDWIVSRYLDKMLEQLKIFKLSINRIEFKVIEESNKISSDSSLIVNFSNIKLTSVKLFKNINRKVRTNE